ncbi:MAG: hypothetical protein A3C47_06970 [Omnitrophica bacterium RIFCSPHIGHO2_02_FULL_51_18]|nr:MAG: hypothetical protein A3C47_06970 [Omnitrophica bacterium RIFCSPHIGHO2_02_FULL_51_18]
MNSFLTIFRRELSAYFGSAIAYIFLVVFILFTNGLYMVSFFQIGKADMRPFFNSLPFVLNLFIPAISMRLWAEEKRGNTFELLMTFPMRPWQLVLGKYVASLIFYLFALLLTLTVPVMLFQVSRPDLGSIASGYLGAFLIGALFLAIGIFLSGLSKDQIVAFILTVISTFAIFFVGTEVFASFLDGWWTGAGTFIRQNLSITSHLTGFGKGVIDIKDILYFTVMIVLFLALNGLSLEGRYRPKGKIVFSGAVVVCFVIAVLLNWLFRDLGFSRFDLTEGQAYTVSEVSARVLRNLKVPVQVKLYMSPSESMPTLLKNLERDVVDKLEELRSVSDNKFTYRVVHLEPGGDAEDPVRKTLQPQGVIPFQVESIQRDEVGVKLIYSTLIIEYKEKTNEIIPRIVPQTVQDLEYQILSRIYKMTLESRPNIAVYAPVKGQALSSDLDKILKGAGEDAGKDYEDDFKTAVTLMRNNGYGVNRIGFTENDPVPDKTRMLILMNPGVLTERQRYEINRYLYEGGTVFLAAQGFKYTFAREEKGVEALPERQDLFINQLTEKWGVKVNDSVLFDESSQIISLVTGQTVGPFALQMPVKFPNQIIVQESFINRSVSVMNRLPSIGFLWGSALDLSADAAKQAGLKSTVLFTSTPQSWKAPNDGHTRLTQENTQPPKEKQDGKFPLAVLLEGQFSDTFGGKRPAWSATQPEGENPEQKPMENPKPGKLIMVGCSSAFGDDVIQNPGNLNLFANIIDGFALGEDLVQIRSKAGVIRDIRKVSNAQKLWFKFFTVFLLPLLLTAWALISAFLRRREKELYQSAYAARGE